MEASRRGNKRQAAPFRKEREANPQRPGRKKGHPPAQRAKSDRVERVLEAKLAHTTCLTCGGELVGQRVEVQYQVDIPPVEPVVTQFNLEVARCAVCGQRAQARHPEQISAALGAAAVQLGPRVRALGGKLGLTNDLDGPYLVLPGLSALFQTVVTLSFLAIAPFPREDLTCG